MSHYEFQEDFPRSGELTATECEAARITYLAMFNRLANLKPAKIREDPLSPFLQSYRVPENPDKPGAYVLVYLADWIDSEPYGEASRINLARYDEENDHRGGSAYTLRPDGIVYREDMPDEKGITTGIRKGETTGRNQGTWDLPPPGVLTLMDILENHAMAIEMGLNRQPVDSDELNGVEAFVQSRSAHIY